MAYYAFAVAWYWLRDASVAYSSNFNNVNNNGNVNNNNNNATNVGGVDLRILYFQSSHV